VRRAVNALFEIFHGLLHRHVEDQGCALFRWGQLSGRCEHNGGSVVTSAEVAAILLEGTNTAGVRMSNGREFRGAQRCGCGQYL
jgi:hypothetical protein